MINEKNIKQAFILVKSDIINLQRELLEVNIRQQRIMEMLSKQDKKLVKVKFKPKKRKANKK